MKRFGLANRLRDRLNSLTTNTAKVWLGIGVLSGLFTYGQINLFQSHLWVNHTFDVLEAIQKLKADLISTQLEFGSTPTKDEGIAYTKWRLGLVQQSAAQLKALTLDNPGQQARIETLRILLNQTSAEREAALRSPSTQTSLTPSSDFLVLYTKPVQLQIAEIEAEEKLLLNKRRNATNTEGFFVSCVTLLGLALVALLLWQLSRSKQKQQKLAEQFSEQIQRNALEQDLNSHLLACRSFGEAHLILRSALHYFLPGCAGAIFEINNSRDEMAPTVPFGDFCGSEGEACSIEMNASPRDCWALRRGEIQYGKKTLFAIPCQLCQKIHPEGTPKSMMCVNLSAHEKTFGILHLADVPEEKQAEVVNLARQMAPPLAVLHLQSELEYLSFHDANTGIYNRRFLVEMLRRAIGTAKRLNYNLDGSDRSGTEALSTVGLIFLDIDHFKHFNDKWGYETGDAVLQIVARLLEQLIRSDDTACRYGGEEFVIILPGASAEATFKKAEQMREAIKHRQVAGGETITISAGVAAYPGHGGTPEELLRQAHAAQSKAKTEGRDRVLMSG